MSGTIEARVFQLVADVLGLRPERVTLETSHRSVDGWDSAATVDMVMALESEFGVSLSIDDAAKLDSVKAILALLQERGAT